MRFMMTIAAGALLLVGCSKAQDQQVTPAMMMDVAPAPPPADQPMQPPPIVPPNGAGEPTQTQSFIAYTYSVAYRLGGAAIAPLQTRQTAICTALGAARCRVANSSLSSSDDGEAWVDGRPPAGTGQTKFLVDARLARAFIAKLDAATSGAGGTVASRQVESEDVTKQVIDTDARVRAKQALADRLMKLIGNANAKVGELVEAERAFAETQEELDSARSLQANLRQRVRMSEVSVTYSSATAPNSWGVVGDRISEAGGTLATSIATMVTFVVTALPWVLLLALLIWIARRRGWRLRWPWRRREEPSQP